ncbi:hypothetical protein [Winogradskyella tangerina]|uniref:hypothetical protein n=1 Tax=Winogradskyella tangerina TaxID=2023240 RepID=UPI000DBE6E18|nr:hypothetical protein [Winogradskyella tangerina]
MRLIITVLFIAFSITSVSYAQTNNLETQVKLAVKAPLIHVEDLKPVHVSKLVTKIQSMITSYGISSVDYINDFMIYPEYEIYDHSEIQTGLGKVHSIEALLTLKVIDIKTMTLFDTMTIELKGEDRGSKDKAITKSISRIKTKSDAVEKFLTSVKMKIISHYQDNCNQIYADAKILLNNGQLEKAIGLLQTVPRNLGGSCYEQIQALQTKAYLIYNDIICEKTIDEAKKAINNKNPDYAIELLNLISTNSSCYSNAKKLLEEIKSSNDKPKKSQIATSKANKRKVQALEKVAKEVLQEEEAAFMCANYNENCN